MKSEKLQNRGVALVTVLIIGLVVGLSLSGADFLGNNLAQAQVSSGLQVDFPSAGFNLNVGQTYTISWSGIDSSVYLTGFSIQLFRDEIAPPYTPPYLIVNIPKSSINQVSYNWTVPELSGGKYYIAITCATFCGPRYQALSSVFTIVNPIPTIKVLSPNGGETWEVGKTQFISWQVSDPTAPVGVYLSGFDEFGGTYIAETIVPGILGQQSSISWIVPSTVKPGKYLIRAVANPNDKTKSAEDSSDASFTITAPVAPDPPPSTQSIKVISPNGGETWEAGKTYPISWSGVKVGTVQILAHPWLSNLGNLSGFTHSVDTTRSYILIGNFANENTGSFSWSILNTALPGKYFIRLFCANSQCNDANNDDGDDSDLPFTIVAPTAIIPAPTPTPTPTPTAKTIKVNLNVNGQVESVAVQQGDVMRVSWTSEGSEAVLGCKGSGSYGNFTVNGNEWVNSTLATSGSADVTVAKWNATGIGFSIYCWLGDWPQNAKFGENIAKDEVLLLDKSVGTASSKGSIPAIISLTPNSGLVGTKVQITGSGFTNNNDIIFVGSTNPVSVAADNTVSPINGETLYKSVNSSDGKTLTFTVPSILTQSGEGGTTQIPVIPGIYYVVVGTDNGKSGVSYFKVTAVGENSIFVSPTTSFISNQNLELRDLGPEVTKLQSLLAKDQSIYPEGSITGYFGSLTQKAVQRFQCKYKIVCSGTPETTGYGIVGPKTRFTIDEVFGGQTQQAQPLAPTPAPPVPAPTPTETIVVLSLQQQINTLLEQIKKLQDQLKLQQSQPPAQTSQPASVTPVTPETQPGELGLTDEETKTFSYTWNQDLYYGLTNNADVRALQNALILEGVYSGPVTGNFFGLTRDGIMAFQRKHNFTLIPDTGYVGSYTRKVLNELYSR